MQNESQERWTCKNDIDAEWILSVIKKEKEDKDRLISVCEEMIRQYKEKIEQYKEKYDKSTSYLTSQLMEYFDTVDKKKTKTKESYTLPSGKLIRKKVAPEIKRDEEKLTEWVESNCVDYLKIKKQIDWAELKKTLTQKDNCMITKDGEIVEGVTLVEREDEFKVEVE